MRFLGKSGAFLSEHQGLRYPQERTQAKDVLVSAQSGYCAYSERYLMPLDSIEVEHFDPRLKGTDDDSISNWHAVIRWMNSHKARKIENYLPLPNLADWDDKRVWYKFGGFACSDDDVEAKNLLRFLGVNKPEVHGHRSKHVARIQRTLELIGLEELFHILKEHPEETSFPSALEHELGLNLSDLLGNE